MTSIRARLAFYFTALFVVLLSVFSMFLYGFVTHEWENEFRRDLEHEAKLVKEIIKENKGPALTDALDQEAADSAFGIRVLDSASRVMFRSDDLDYREIHFDPVWLDQASQSPVWSRQTVNGKSSAVWTKAAVFPSNELYYLQIVSSRKDLDQLEKAFSLWIIILTPAVIALAVVMGLVFAKKALAPIETIRKKADLIRAENLSERLPIPQHRDELFLLTETLNQLLERIHDAFLKIKNFTADVSHELRIPVTVLKGTLEVALRKDRSKEDYRVAIEEVSEEADKLSQLVEDMLTLARADAGPETITLAEVSLREFIQALFEDAEKLNRDHKVKIYLEAVPEASVKFDPDLIRRLMLNLIDNAIKYNKEGGEVRISAAVSNQILSLSVKDTGLGISTDDQKKVFDRFYRTDKARSRTSGGFGLGLAIAGAIAAAHKGSLSVDSQPGAGTEFRLTLPTLKDSNPPFRIF